MVIKLDTGARLVEMRVVATTAMVTSRLAAFRIRLGWERIILWHVVWSKIVERLQPVVCRNV